MDGVLGIVNKSRFIEYTVQLMRRDPTYTQCKELQEIEKLAAEIYREAIIELKASSHS